jgi:hypothetical protein
MKAGGQSRKGSVYLDAMSDPPTDDQPSLTELMRELRDIPDAIDDEITSNSNRLAAPNMLPIQPLSLSSPSKPSRGRTLRHSFSSSTMPSSIIRPSHTLEDDAEAVVELHEESASAFQDFLFWAYPHLDCRVSWTNVEAVSQCSNGKA